MRDRDRDDTGIEVSLEFFPLAWFLFFCTPRVVLDGRTYKCQWGKNFFDTRPGNYEVEVYYPYLFRPECGHAVIDVDVERGQITRIDYYHWAFLVFLPGSIREGRPLDRPSPPGSSTKKWALITLLLAAVTPLLCCGAGTLLGKFGQQQKEEEIARKHRDEDQLQGQRDRAGWANAFANAVGQDNLAAAYNDLTTPAFQGRTDRKAFEAMLRDRGVAGAFTLVEDQDNPREPRPQYLFRYLAFPKDGRVLRLTCTVTAAHGKVDDVAVEEAAEKPPDAVSRVGETRARELFQRLQDNTPDVAYTLDGTKAVASRPNRVPEPVRQFMPLRPGWTLLDVTPERVGPGWGCTARARAAGIAGQERTLVLTLRPEGVKLMLEQLAIE